MPHKMFQVDNLQISVSGRVLRTARLRHEWCDFLEDPQRTIEKLRTGLAAADLFTFVPELSEQSEKYPFHTEPCGISILKIKDYQTWWDGLHFKVRNKVRKAGKSGVNLRLIQLDQDFARGVAMIYNESPIRQGRRFFHYGKGVNEVMEELSSFLDRAYFIGAYHGDELIGFMKLFHGKNVLRTVHFIPKLSHREKCVMDALIGEAVALCSEKKVEHLQYGSWTDGGVGVFREKHGFVRFEVNRYFVPLTLRGEMMLKLKLHSPMRDRLPKSWVERMIKARTTWNTLWQARVGRRIAT